MMGTDTGMQTHTQALGAFDLCSQNPCAGACTGSTAGRVPGIERLVQARRQVVVVV